MLICVQCQTEVPDGRFQCPSCKSWNTVEVSELNEDTEQTKLVLADSPTLDKVRSAEHDRYDVGPLNFVLGGGLVRTSVILLGGAPGAGKSTLLLQLSAILAGISMRENTNAEVVYIAAEEDLPEIKLRADRLNLDPEAQKRIRMIPALSGSINVGQILSTVNPCLIILDSLQGLLGPMASGSLDLLGAIKKVAIKLKAPAIVISQVNKDFTYEGLMALQHKVDVLLTADHEEDETVTIGVKKNRYGRAFVQVFFRMEAEGLVYQSNSDEEKEEEIKQLAAVNDDESEDEYEYEYTYEEVEEEEQTPPD